MNWVLIGIDVVLLALVAAGVHSFALRYWQERGLPREELRGPQWSIGWAVITTLSLGVILGLNLIVYFAWLSTKGYRLWDPSWFSEVRDGGWFEAARAAVTAIAAIGVGGAAYLAFRRQHSKEAERADALDRDQMSAQRDLYARYTEAAKQLGDDKYSIRLAGVYSFTALADDWIEFGRPAEAQSVLNVLTAYLRTDTFPTMPVAGSTDQEVAAAEKGRSAEREVRASIVGVIRERRQLAAAGAKWETLTVDDLSGADLAKADFSGVDLGGARLTGANLAGAKLIGVDLRGADLSGANLSDVDLTEGDLTDTNLSGVVLDRAVLVNAVMMGSIVSGSSLFQANLTGANLTAADLTDASLKFADVTRVDFVTSRRLWRIAVASAGRHQGWIREGEVYYFASLGFGRGMHVPEADRLFDALTPEHRPDAILSGANLEGVRGVGERQFSNWQLDRMAVQPPFSLIYDTEMDYQRRRDSDGV